MDHFGVADLTSLAIPTCMLCGEDPSVRVQGKRIMTTRNGSYAPKRRQLSSGYVEVRSQKYLQGYDPYCFTIQSRKSQATLLNS